MPTQPILLVIGIAIAVNLVIMGGLVVTLIARRRGRFATAEGFVEPSPYRYAAMETAPPTATSPISFIGSEPEDEYDLIEEDIDEDVSATEPADYRRFRPVMSDEGERADSTIASFLSGGAASAAPPPTPVPPPAAAEPAPAPPVQAPRPLAHLTPRPSGPAIDGTLDWEVRVRDEEARLARYRRPVSVVLVELDGLGRLSERVGLDAAERIVPPVGQTLVRQARAADHVARTGMSRFAILLPETDEIQAINYVERVRAECDRWLAAGAVSMRLAIGWACPTPGGDLRTATRLAEDRLNADRRQEFPRAELEFEPAPARGPRPFTAGSNEAGGPGAVELTPPDGAE
jgi:diguanylate cyclase (GGDEF)-like protein